jgi:2-deoxy-D-gluconate 3-dehydrogenase
MPNNIFDVSGKVAIVTGGNGGIGKAIATGLAKAGADIVIVARNEEKTAKAVAEIMKTGQRCIGIKCDVTKAEDIHNTVKKTIQEFGRLDILVNDAGTSANSPPEVMTEEQWDTVLDTNLKAAFLFSQAAYPEFKRGGGGKIINIGSMMAFFGDKVSVPYSVSKGGVVQLTKSLAIAWAPDNIQVNAICPGWFLTDLTAPFKADVASYQSIIKRTPAGRFGELEELGGAAVFLSSAASSFVTGQSILVDGGFSIQAL